MILTLGQTLQLATTVTVGPTLTDPGSITCAVTAPGGATTTYTTGSSPNIVRQTVGSYTLTLTPAALGTYSYTWTTTGNGAATGTGTFTVNSATSLAIPGLQEATRKALQNVIQASLPGLNTMLTADGLWPASRPITASMVRRGDVVRMPPLAQYPMMFCVEAGGKPTGQDFSTERRFISGSPPGFRNEIYTNIYAYLHQDVYKEMTDPEAQSEMRQDLLSRLSDWLRGAVFNTTANAVIPLASNETGNPAGYDWLDKCMARRGYLGYFDKSFGDKQVLFGVHVVHFGLVAGG